MLTRPSVTHTQLLLAQLSTAETRALADAEPVPTVKPALTLLTQIMEERDATERQVKDLRYTVADNLDLLARNVETKGSTSLSSDLPGDVGKLQHLLGRLGTLRDLVSDARHAAAEVWDLAHTDPPKPLAYTGNKPVTIAADCNDYADPFAR